MLFHNKFSMIALVLSLAMIVVAAAGSAETDVRYERSFWQFAFNAPRVIFAN